MSHLSRVKELITKLSPEDLNKLTDWLRSRSGSSTPPQTAGGRLPAKNPAAVNRKLLPGFVLTHIPLGWKGKFPGGAKLFGKPVLLIAETQEMPDFSKRPAPVSERQAALVKEIRQNLPAIVKRAKKEIEAIGIEPDEDGDEIPLNIYVWLHFKNDDGTSWELVAERANGSNFGYHLAYQGTRFVEAWAGD